jgi:hypothetical protein
MLEVLKNQMWIYFNSQKINMHLRIYFVAET